MITALLVLSALGADCGSRNAQQPLRDVAEGIVAADNARAIDKVLSYYADDALLMPPNEPSVSGLAAIRPRYEGLFRDFNPAIESHVEEVCVAGEHGYVLGHNGGWLRSRRSAGDRALDDMYMMLLARNARGAWKITHLIWHRASATLAQERGG
jgi:ketosteroid isomerase-like protein